MHRTHGLERPHPDVRTGGVLQRQCACGNHSHGHGECDSCKKRHADLRGADTPPGFAWTGREWDLSRVPAQFIGDDLRWPSQTPDAGRPADAGTSDAGTPADAGPARPNCTDICNRAYASSSLNHGGGGVICDGATKCACVFDVSPLTRGQCPAFDGVVLTHERRHLTDVDCNASGGLHRPPFRDPSQATRSECTHRRESIAEIDRLIPRAAGACKTGMTAIRARLQTWVTANCGSADAGASSDAGAPWRRRRGLKTFPAMPIYEALKIAVEYLQAQSLMYRDEYKLTASRVDDEWVFWFRFLPETPGLDVTVYVGSDGRVRHLVGM